MIVEPKSKSKKEKRIPPTEEELKDRFIEYFDPDFHDDTPTKTATLIEDYLDSLDPLDLIRVDKRFITQANLQDQILSRKIVCIKSHMGSGKTTLLSDLIKR